MARSSPSRSVHSLAGSIGAYRLAATHDPRETTRKARETFLARFEADIDPNLPRAEQDRRAAAARKAHFALLALRSAQARRR